MVAAVLLIGGGFIATDPLSPLLESGEVMLVSIEDKEELHELTLIENEYSNEYTITNYLTDLKDIDALIIAPPPRDWYVPRKAPLTGRISKRDRPRQQEYG